MKRSVNYEWDGMCSVHLHSAPSIQHLCTPHHLLSLTLIRHPLTIHCCVSYVSPLFLLTILTRAHKPCLFSILQGTIKDAQFIWYHHLWHPLSPHYLYTHHNITASHVVPFTLTILLFIIFLLFLICESDSVIYNPLAWDLQIQRIVVEMVSALTMVCGEWLGVHVHGFISWTSSAVSAARARTSKWKWMKGRPGTIMWLGIKWLLKKREK